jgi:hypothetical protein
MKSESQDLVAEDRQSLWLLTVSPTIWAAHFLASYISAAIWCGNVADREVGLGTLRVAIIGLAIIALIGIAFTGSRGWRKRTYGGGEPPYNKDTAEDRHRFLGLATVLLSGRSAIATIYSALATLFIGSCI